MKKAKTRQLTIGLDLGNRKHAFCVLGKTGGPVEENQVSNTREALAVWAGKYPRATVAMEAGAHSPWVSRYLTELGLRVVVANPRKTRAIYQSERKSDRRDAEMLARIARSDEALLCPVKHGSEEAQRDLLQIKLRDSLVRSRVALINSVRATLKSLGHPVSNPSSARFHKIVLDEVPDEVGGMIVPSVAAIAELTEQIRVLEAAIVKLRSGASCRLLARCRSLPGGAPRRIGVRALMQKWCLP